MKSSRPFLHLLSRVSKGVYRYPHILTCSPPNNTGISNLLEVLPNLSLKSESIELHVEKNFFLLKWTLPFYFHFTLAERIYGIRHAPRNIWFKEYLKERIKYPVTTPLPPPRFLVTYSLIWQHGKGLGIVIKWKSILFDIGSDITVGLVLLTSVQNEFLTCFKLQALRSFPDYGASLFCFEAQIYKMKTTIDMIPSHAMLF